MFLTKGYFCLLLWGRTDVRFIHFLLSPEAKMDIFELFMEIDPYCRLKPQSVAEISASFHEKTCMAGETFIEQGQPVEWFGLIRFGSAQVSVRDCQGTELSCSILQPRDMMLDLALLTGMTATTKVTCLERTSFWVQYRKSFLESLNEHPLLKNFFHHNITTAIAQYHHRNCCRHRSEIVSEGTEHLRYPFLQRALNFIEKNYQKPITLEMVAKEAAMSKFHFSRLFKQHTGMSFKQYLNRKRIKVAKELLLRRGYSITEVGYAVGFNDSSYFSRVFREVEGCSPRSQLPFDGSSADVGTGHLHG